MTLRELRVGEWFTLEGYIVQYQYLGNGWYGRPYSGGPFYTPDNPVVVPFEFELRNDPPRKPPTPIDNNDRSRQSKLFTGLDCLPGQQDLFDNP
jgi:hypothetical protein